MWYDGLIKDTDPVIVAGDVFITDDGKNYSVLYRPDGNNLIVDLRESSIKSVQERCGCEKRLITPATKIHGHEIQAVYRFVDGEYIRVWGNKVYILTDFEKAIIKMAKQYGCHYIAMNKSRQIVGFSSHPTKNRRKGYWQSCEACSNGVFSLSLCMARTSVHFISWEDEEPYEIIY